MSECSSLSHLLQETTKYSSNLIPFETNKLEIIHTKPYIARFPKSKKNMKSHLGEDVSCQSSK